MNDELKIDLEGSSSDLTEVLSWHLPGDTQKNHAHQSAQPSVWLKLSTYQIQLYSITAIPASSVVSDAVKLCFLNMDEKFMIIDVYKTLLRDNSHPLMSEVEEEQHI
jgi:hypothetical protein